MTYLTLKDAARVTTELLAQGAYTNAHGQTVSLQPALAQAVHGTRTFTPDQLNALLGDAQPAAPGAQPARVSVSGRSTQQAAHDWVQAGVDDMVLLNFASARNAGGGFINGAKAQEEDLCRCSALYPCLLPQTAYYATNRKQDSLLYTDHLIHSPAVPWFRTSSNGPLLDAPFLASVISAPAPNAGAYLLHGQGGWDEVDACLLRRAGLVLALARAQGHRHLLLGAWGCGVFRNRPDRVAEAFARWLAAPAFATAFEQVHFAVYDRSTAQDTLRAFEARLG